MKVTNLIILLAIFIIVSATTGCKKDDDSYIESVTEASWYFGTWKEIGTGNLLELSRTDVVFSSSSELQYYASLKWYDAGDESANVFFGYNTAGGYFQATEGNNPIPNPYYFNHEGELLAITTLSYKSTETKVGKLWEKESTNPPDPNSFGGIYQADWNCFNGQPSDDPGLTAFDFKDDGTYRYIKGMYDLYLPNPSNSCPDVPYYTYNVMGLIGTWTREGDVITLSGSITGTLVLVEGSLQPGGYPVFNSCGELSIYKKVDNSIGFTEWGGCEGIDW